MARPARGADNLEWAREVLALAQAGEQLRQAQAVVLPLDYGLSLAQTARARSLADKEAFELCAAIWLHAANPEVCFPRAIGVSGMHPSTRMSAIASWASALPKVSRVPTSLKTTFGELTFAPS